MTTVARAARNMNIVRAGVAISFALSPTVVSTERWIEYDITGVGQYYSESTGYEGDIYVSGKSEINAALFVEIDPEYPSDPYEYPDGYFYYWSGGYLYNQWNFGEYEWGFTAEVTKDVLAFNYRGMESSY